MTLLNFKLFSTTSRSRYTRNVISICIRDLYTGVPETYAQTMDADSEARHMKETALF